MPLTTIEIQNLDDWISRVNVLGLRFPGTAIAKATGFDKAYISKILKKKLALSDNFLTKFNEVYPHTLTSQMSLREQKAVYGGSGEDRLLNIIATQAETIRRQNEMIYNFTKQGKRTKPCKWLYVAWKRVEKI